MMKSNFDYYKLGKLGNVRVKFPGTSFFQNPSMYTLKHKIWMPNESNKFDRQSNFVHS